MLVDTTVSAFTQQATLCGEAKRSNYRVLKGERVVETDFISFLLAFISWSSGLKIEEVTSEAGGYRVLFF